MSDDTLKTSRSASSAAEVSDVQASREASEAYASADSEIATQSFEGHTQATEAVLRSGPWEPAHGALLGGAYRLARSLGSGGMGAVWLAEDRAGQHVAIKWLRDDKRADAEARERFAREARIVLALRHPGIVRGMAVGKLPDGRDYLVMAYAEGRTLDVVLRERGRLPFVEAAHVALQIADALHAVHEAGVVHRDLKPSNVFISGDAVDLRRAQARLLDLGICHDGSLPSGMTLTSAGTILGTPAYTSPEQLAGGQITPKADLFALGVLMYKMVSGRLPFPGGTFTEVFKLLRAAAPPSLRTIEPDASRPAAFDALVEALLARDPDARPTNAREARDALSAFARPPRPSRKRVLLAALSAVALGLAVGIAIGFSR